MKPRFSVVIPTYNRAETLRHVLPSLGRQTYPLESYEIILADSNSTDGTEELVRDLRIINLRHLRADTKTRAAARNIGIREAHGGIILFTDADIIASETLLEEHSRMHDLFSGGAVVGCEVRVDTLEEYEKVKQNPASGRTLHHSGKKRLPWLYFLTGNASVQREKLLEVGGFDESFTGYGHEDLELGYRLEKAGMIIRYNPRAVNFHWHPVDFSEQCKRMRLAGASTVRFYRKHRDPRIAILLGMTPLSLGIHSFLSPDGCVLRICGRLAKSSHICREIVLQYNYICGIKEALRRQAAVEKGVG